MEMDQNAGENLDVAALLKKVEGHAELVAILTAALQAASAGPTARGAGERIRVADLVTKSIEQMTPNTSRTYAGYMEFLAKGDPECPDPQVRAWKGLGQMWVDEVLPSHLTKALMMVSARAACRAEGRAQVRRDAERVVRDTDGTGARFSAVGAWRRLFRDAIADRHLAPGMNPAMDLTKPKRKRGGSRFALEEPLFGEAVRLISTTGDDPELDAMIVTFIDVTGARQEGVLNLTVGGLDRSECTVLLIEKFGTRVHQPVPDWFMAQLVRFAESRGATGPADKVFRKRLASGKVKAITPRRFNYIFCDRLQASLTWADKLQVTAHTLRHHSITRVERHSGRAVARAFARHAPEGVTDIYTEASREEVAQAVVELHGGDHPWLHRAPLIKA